MSDTHAETVAYVRDEMLPQAAPPSSAVGALGWARANLFSNWFNAILTILSLFFIYEILAGILPWILSPTWVGGSLNECRGILAELGREGHFSGACWGVIRDRWIQLLFGFYPADLYWRPILAFLLLGVALAPVLFSDRFPAKLLWFSALYPVIFPWLLWGGAVWTPVLVVVGFALAYLAFRAIAARLGGLSALIAGVLVLVLWFMWGMGAVNDGINRAIGGMRMDAQEARLTDSIARLETRNAALLAEIDEVEASIAEQLALAEAALADETQNYRDILVAVVDERNHLDDLRRDYGLVQSDLSDQQGLLRQIEALPGVRETLPAQREAAAALRAALPDTVDHVTTRNGYEALQASNRQDGLGIPLEDFEALDAALSAEALVSASEATLRQTYADVARFGLEPVESRSFGGFMLSITIGVVAIAASLPLGIVLALGRQSDLMIVKYLCVGFIEFIRGVPLITLLFVASTLLNIFMPPGTNFDIILRVLIMVTLFASAHMAEVIRGGLAALPKGQYEAADSLGLDYWQAQRLVIMPQALKISIPGIVSTFIGVFKDTTLVSIIGLLDPLGLSNAIRADSAWNGIVWELYGFIAVLFFIFCFGMSRYSMYLERRLHTGH